MATVTGFTAARMLEIENSTVVGGKVVNDHLMLATRGGVQLDAGAVKGAKGDKGDSVKGDKGDTGSRGPAGYWGGTTAERNTAYAGLTPLQLANGRKSWFNTDLGWLEMYVAVSTLSGLTVPGGYAPSGWYPIQSGVIAGRRGLTSGFVALGTAGLQITMPAAQLYLGGMAAAPSGNGLVISTAGYYRVSNKLYASGIPADVVSLDLRVNGVSFFVVSIAKPNSNDVQVFGDLIYSFNAGDVVTAWASATHATNVYGVAPGYNTFFALEYVRPPLRNY